MDTSQNQFYDPAEQELELDSREDEQRRYEANEDQHMDDYYDAKYS